MIRAALFILSLAAAPPAMAETVRVLSGEHPGFTRLAFVLQEPTEWQFGRIAPASLQTTEPVSEARVYEIRLSRSDIDLDISGVFDRVPRTRLTDLATQPGGRLRLSVAPGNRAVPFTLRDGVVVIDVRTGPPPPDSPFEKRLSRAVPNVSQSADPGTIPTGLIAAAADPGATSDILSVIRDRSFWATYIGQRWQVPLTAARRAGPQNLPPSQVPDPRTPRIFTAAPTAADPAGLLGSILPGGLATGSRPVDPATADIADAAPPDTLGRFGPRRSASVSDPTTKPPGVDIERAQKLIVEQIARAATQGLVTPAAPNLPDTTEPPKESGTGAPSARPSPPRANKPQINVTAQTSMDRDSFARVRRALLGDKPECPDPAAFDVAAWGRGAEPARLIAEGRIALLGEFDRVRHDAVSELARRYLYLGFGSEAAALIRAFPGTIPDRDRLLTLAAIMEGRLPDPGAPVLTMARCDSAAALWSLLSHPAGVAVPGLNVAAAQRSFSDLPGHLRTYLAPALSERLIALGKAEAAASVRNAVRRLKTRPYSEANEMDTRLSLDTDAGEIGTFSEREQRLLAVIGNDGPGAIPALIQYLDGRLARDLPVTASFAEQAAALAFVTRNTEDGPALMRAEILARAAAGNFVEAFAALGRANTRADTRTGAVAAVPPETIDPLLDLLTQKAPDIVFLEQVFGPVRTVLAPGDVSPETVSRLSERLLALGFPTEARQLLTARTPQDDRGRRLLARTELALGNGQEALRVIAGLEGAQAEALRARAMAQQGKFAEAARALDATGDPDAAARIAWLASDWTTYQRLRTDARSAALNRLALARQGGSTASGATNGRDADKSGPVANAAGQTDDSPSTGLPRAQLYGVTGTDDAADIGASGPTVANGVLARNRVLLGQSRDLRAALNDLRAALPFAADEAAANQR